MKTNPSITRKFISALTLGLMAAGHQQIPEPITEPHKREGARKSSGGSKSRRRMTRRLADPRYHAWKRVFGGIACPSYLSVIVALCVMSATAFGQNVFVTNDSTHAVPITGTVTGSTAGSTGSPVPAAASYEGINISGTLRGITGVNPSGSIFAAQNDVSSIAGTTVGTAAAGVQKVGIVGNAGGAVDSATGAAVPANGIFNGARAATANPANATGGNLVGQMADKAGRIVVTEGNVRELIGVQTTTISASTAETTIVGAGGAGVFNDISQINITTTNTAAATLTLKDATGGTTRAVWNYPATAANPIMPLVIPFTIPMTQAAAANNWTLTASVNAGNFIVNVVYVKNL